MGQNVSQGVGDTSVRKDNAFAAELQPMEHNIPEEILIHILSYVDAKTLLNFRQVCRLWKHFIDNEVWKLKVSHRKYKSLKGVDCRQKLPWIVYYCICVKDPFQKNLLKNHCGQDQLKYWDVISSAGDHWAIEDPPHGADSLPQTEEFDNLTSCFATSYHSCSKEQLVDLFSMGVNSKIMNELRPYIEISEWYAGRFDCGCVYEMRAVLLNANMEPVTDHVFRITIKQWEGRAWHQIRHVFQNYGQGVRYVKFYHGGMDTQFWAGHYGSKMSGACVRLHIPPASSRTSSDEDESDTDNGDVSAVVFV